MKELKIEKNRKIKRVLFSRLLREFLGFLKKSVIAVFRRIRFYSREKVLKGRRNHLKIETLDDKMD